MFELPLLIREANPVLAREARIRMRGWRSVFVLTGHLGLLGLAAFGFYYLTTQVPGFSSGTQVGPGLYTLLAIMELFLVIFISPALTSGAISGERERSTLDLTLVTSLSSMEIILGKLLSALGFMLLMVVSAMPLFSIVFLLGGISLDQFILTFAVLFMSALTYGSIGLLASSLFRSTRAATVASYAGILLTLLAPVALLILLEVQPGPVKIGWGSLLVMYLNPFGAMASVLTGDWVRNALISAPLGTPIVPLLTRWAPWVYHFVLEIIVIVLLLALSARLLAAQRGGIRRRRKETPLPQPGALGSEQGA